MSAEMPFILHEVNHTEEGWKPNLGKEYLVQYRWKGEKKSVFLVGSFSKVWFGYTFHWFWGASSLQLSTNSSSDYDLRRFVGIWEVERLPEPDSKGRQTNLITQEDIDL